MSGMAVTGESIDMFEVAGGTCADGAQLDPGESCEVDVIYVPTEEAEHTAVLVVSGVEVALAGAGDSRPG